MSIYVTGDIHGEVEVTRLADYNFPEGASLTKDDFVIVLGDFGLIWDREESDLERKWLAWLSGQPFTTLFIDGNHENFDRLLAYPVMDFHGGKASRIHDSVYYLRRGEIFRFDGKTCFAMGGAISTDLQHRVIGESWWREEMPNYADWDNAAENLAAVNNVVDYVFTHTAPTDIIGRMIDQSHCFIDFTRLRDPVSSALERIQKEISFKRWYFGHFHCNWEYKQYTCLYRNIEELK